MKTRTRFLLVFLFSLFLMGLTVSSAQAATLIKGGSSKKMARKIEKANTTYKTQFPEGKTSLWFKFKTPSSRSNTSIELKSLIENVEYYHVHVDLYVPGDSDETDYGYFGNSGYETDTITIDDEPDLNSKNAWFTIHISYTKPSDDLIKKYKKKNIELTPVPQGVINIKMITKKDDAGNTAKTATTLTAGKTFSGELGNCADYDYFKFKPTKTKTYKITAVNKTKTYKGLGKNISRYFTVQILDNKQTYLSGDGMIYTSSKMSVKLTKGKWYYILAKPGWAGKYTLKIS